MAAVWRCESCDLDGSILEKLSGLVWENTAGRAVVLCTVQQLDWITLLEVLNLMDMVCFQRLDIKAASDIIS